MRHFVRFLNCKSKVKLVSNKSYVDSPRILASISICHFLNDMLQSVLLAMYPLLKSEFALSFTQIGFITLAYQFTASLLQPLVGIYTDKRPQYFSTCAGMVFTFCGLLLLALAASYSLLLIAAALVGIGSSIFHPESSRIARMAAGKKLGFAQSVFQVGGNFGQAVGPLFAAGFILPRGRISVIWVSIFALLGVFLLARVGVWYRSQQNKMNSIQLSVHRQLPMRSISFALLILFCLLFSKYFYLASLNSFLTFYLIEKFNLNTQIAQFYLFVFLFAVAVGTLIGGIVGDRIGRKNVIWISIFGTAPFSLAIPYANLAMLTILIIFSGLILASAFSAIIVYAQELLPGRVGFISGIFFGLSFGLGGIGAALLGKFADATNLITVFKVCAYLPLIGIITYFLPNIEKTNKHKI